MPQQWQIFFSESFLWFSKYFHPPSVVMQPGNRKPSTVPGRKTRIFWYRNPSNGTRTRLLVTFVPKKPKSREEKPTFLVPKPDFCYLTTSLSSRKEHVSKKLFFLHHSLIFPATYAAFATFKTPPHIMGNLLIEPPKESYLLASLSFGNPVHFISGSVGSKTSDGPLANTTILSNSKN